MNNFVVSFTGMSCEPCEAMSERSSYRQRKSSEKIRTSALKDMQNDFRLKIRTQKRLREAQRKHLNVAARELNIDMQSF